MYNLTNWPNKGYAYYSAKKRNNENCIYFSLYTFVIEWLALISIQFDFSI